MTEFSINVHRLNACSVELQTIEQRLTECASRLETIKGQLVIKGSSAWALKQEMELSRQSIVNHRESTRDMRTNLHTIGNEYKNTENRICIRSNGSVLVAAKAAARGISAGKNVNPVSMMKNLDYSFEDFIKNFGNFGKGAGLAIQAAKATGWNQWANIALSTLKTTSSIWKDARNYGKIIPMVGTKNACSYFLKKQIGLRNVGYASKCESPVARFRNNLLYNETSPYRIKDAFSSLTGKNGAVSAVAAWAGVALTGVKNAFSNIEEQKQSNGTMSTGRVIAETVTETAIDTAVTYAGTAIVGSAIAAATGVVAAPVVVAAVTGVAIAGINAGVKALTGKSATEFVSDAVIDGVTAVGKGVVNGAKAVGKWFESLGT